MLVLAMFLCAVVFSTAVMATGPVARVTFIEGQANMIRGDAGQARQLKVNLPLQVGDQIQSAEESMVEITYKNGEIVRLAEMSSLTIDESGEKAVKSSLVAGRVWVNMKKLTSTKRQFDMESPTAVASIRGTVYDMRAAQDSSVDVSVFDGRVAVGPSKNLNDRLKKENKMPAGEPQEVPGPDEVPGPYEVTLEQWQMIVAGQQISIRADGKYATKSFDLKGEADSFVQKNHLLDSQTGKRR